MAVKTCDTQRLFSVAEANAMLPLVRAITSDLANLSREVVDRHQRVELLSAGRDTSVKDLYSDELSQIAEELEKDRQRLHEYVQELRRLGVEPKSGSDGIVDFPAMLDGQQVDLCWQLGEPEIRYWHPRDAGFAARQPLTSDMA